MGEEAIGLLDQTARIDIGEVKDLRSRMAELGKRYDQCVSGHVQPNADRNRCEHCYQRLEHKASATDKGNRQLEIDIQKMDDWNYGLKQLAG